MYSYLHQYAKFMVLRALVHDIQLDNFNERFAFHFLFIINVFPPMKSFHIIYIYSSPPWKPREYFIHFYLIWPVDALDRHELPHSNEEFLKVGTYARLEYNFPVNLKFSSAC